MISVETYVYIMLILIVLRGIIGVYEGINKNKKETHYTPKDSFAGIILVILGIIALMW